MFMVPRLLSRLTSLWITSLKNAPKCGLLALPLVSQFTLTFLRSSLLVERSTKTRRQSIVRDTLLPKMSGSDFLSFESQNSIPLFASSIMAPLYTVSAVWLNKDQVSWCPLPALRDLARVRTAGNCSSLNCQRHSLTWVPFRSRKLISWSLEDSSRVLAKRLTFTQLHLTMAASRRPKALRQRISLSKTVCTSSLWLTPPITIATSSTATRTTTFSTRALWSSKPFPCSDNKKFVRHKRCLWVSFEQKRLLSFDFKNSMKPSFLD